MTNICAWCGNHLFGAERRGLVCNACLSGETRCDGCGHPLRDHVSGMGCPPYPPQRETAMQTIRVRHPGMSKDFFDHAFHRAMMADLAIMATSRPGTYAVSSGSCDEIDYLVTRETCSCPGGVKVGRCYHRALVCGWLDVMCTVELGSARDADDPTAA